MESKGLVAVDTADPQFRSCVAPGRWTLCLGAGLSRGITPTWFDLTIKIVNSTFGSSYDQPSFEKVVANSGWSLDAWIEAAANEYVSRGKTLDEFNELLESTLYGKLRDDAKGLPIEKHLLQVLNNPISAEKNRVIEVCEFFEDTYKASSLLSMVRFLIAAAEKDRKPHAIITFNADTLLETLIYIFLRRNHYKGPGPHGHPRYHYKSVNRPSLIAHHQYIEKTNIFHCHGAIMMIMMRQAAKIKAMDSRDRLIFLDRNTYE